MTRLVGWAIAVALFGAAVLVGCSGGGSQSPVQSARLGQSAVLAVTLDSQRVQAALERSAKFIGAGATSIAYSLNPDSSNPNGATASSGSLQLSTCANNGTTYSCAIPASAGNYYSMSLTLKAGTVTLGSGTSNACGPLAVSRRPTTTANCDILAPGAVTVTIFPIVSAVTLSLPNFSGFFWVDGGPQGALGAVNELDPVGNSIVGTSTTVPNWETIVVTSSESSVTACSPRTYPPYINQPDYCQLPYSGAVPNATPPASVVIRAGINGGPSAAPVIIPFVQMVASPASPTVLPGATATLTVTEYNGATAGETSFNVSTVNQTLAKIRRPNTATGFNGPPCSGDVTMSPTPGPAVAASTSGNNATLSLSITVKSPSTTYSNCTITVTSNADPNTPQASATFTVTF